MPRCYYTHTIILFKKNELVLNTLQQLLNDPAVEYKETLQDLWSGYGEISRYYSPKLSASVIAKSVNPPQQVNHPRGWHSDVGHQRKLTSYKIEANFYQHYAKYCHQGCYVPQVIAFYQADENTQANLKAQTKQPSQSKEQSENQILVMEDLAHLGFNDNESTLGIEDIRAVIAWLANFHALFLQHKADDLWPIGTYWHLATRQDEYQTMLDGPLKKAAQFIDNQLNNAHYQTIVHGDAKLANFCFGTFDSFENSDDIGSSNKIDSSNEIDSPDTINIPGNLNTDNKDSKLNIKAKLKVKHVAAVDFQYVGKGVGIKDLAYFLGSCLTDSDLTILHEELLDYYFENLAKACRDCQQDINFKALEHEWRHLYSFANADFHRFLQGWSPEHHKINSYLQMQTNLALQKTPFDNLTSK